MPVDLNAFSDAQLRNHLMRRNVDHSEVVDRADLLDLAQVQSQTANRETHEQMLLDEILASLRLGIDSDDVTQYASRIKELHATLPKVKTKPVRSELKKILGHQFERWASKLWNEIFVQQVDPLARALDGENIDIDLKDDFEQIDALYCIALHYNKKMPDALSRRGICNWLRGQQGSALKDLALALTYKDQLHFWNAPEICDTIEKLLLENKTNYRFGNWEKLAITTSPPPRTFSAYCHDDGESRLFVFGGREVSGHQLSDLWVLDMSSEPYAWAVVALREGSAKLPALERAGMCYCKGSLYIYGGEGRGQQQKQLYRVELSSGRCVREATRGHGPGPRSGMAMFTSDQKQLIVYGGGDDTDLWECDLGTMKWSQRKTKGTSHARPNPNLQLFSWWFDAERKELLVWGNTATAKKLHERWQCCLRTGQWQPKPFNGYFVPPYSERACCSGISRGGGHWGFGGFSSIGRECVVVTDADGVASMEFKTATICNEVVFGDSEDNWYFVVPNQAKQDEQPAPRGGAVMAPMPSGDGFVLFGGFSSSFDSNPAEMQRSVTLFQDTWRFRLCAREDTCPGPSTNSAPLSERLERMSLEGSSNTETAGELKVGDAVTRTLREPNPTAGSGSNAAEARQSSVQAQATHPVARFLDIDLYIKAVWTVVKTEVEWRVLLSENSLQQCREHGPGLLVAMIAVEPAPCRDLLRSARFKTASEVRADPTLDLSELEILDSILLDFNPDASFILMLVVATEDSTSLRTDPNPKQFRTYLFANGPGVGVVPLNIQYRQTRIDISKARQVPLPEVPITSTPENVQKVMDATTKEEVLLAVLDRERTRQLKIERCAGPSCNKFEMLNKPGFANPQMRSQGMVSRLFRCPCRQVSYCSTACQQAHWKKHKKACKEATAAGSPPAKRQWNDSLRLLSTSAP